MQFGDAAGQYDHLRRMQIVEALQDLARSMPFEEVAVTTVCREAGISRATFYRYFQDKYEVVQWLWNVPGEVILKQCGVTLGWYESNLEMLRFFTGYRDLFTSALKSDADYNSVLNHGHRRRAQYLADAIRARDPALLTKDVEFQIEFFVLAESQVIGRWAIDGMPETPEALARHIEQCVPPQLHELICEGLAQGEGSDPDTQDLIGPQINIHFAS